MARSFSTGNYSTLFSTLAAAALLLLATGCKPSPTASEATSAAPAQVAPQQVHTNPNAPWQADCDGDIAAIKADIAKLESWPGPFSEETILDPLNQIETRIADGVNFASLMENVHPRSEIRDHASACTTAYADLATQLSLSRGIYDAVTKVDVSDGAEDTQRYHELTLKGFHLSGVDKDEATRNKIRELSDRITQLGQEFDKNILEDVRYIEVSPEELDGLPKDVIAGKPVGENGKIKLSTRYVDSVPVYTYVHSDKVRQQLRQQDQSRGYPQNEKVLKALLTTRHELANVLGFDSYADLITNDKMIGSAANALSFIERVHALAKPAADEDMRKLLARLQQIQPEATKVQRWQSSYLEEQIRREVYQIDSAELRQYFPFAKVKQGMFQLIEHQFDVQIKPWATETWDKSVEGYEMYQGDELIGRFYLDLHPREGKYQHAAAFTYQTGIDGKQLPMSALVCNFAGGSDPNEPMEYAEVQTFLHEFGHLLHSLFGGHQRYARLSGIATEWDFVEAPSQMLEEWMYDTDTLQTFAINAKGESIPADIVERLRAARSFGEGAMTSVQMYYSALSLEYHRLDPASFNLVDKMIELENTYSPFPHQDNTYFFANLGHLNGYSAIYYTYMWSKVIALDMFSQFQTNGLRDKATAHYYRDKVLAPGGAKPAATLVEDFLGRPYNFDAFSRYLTDRKDRPGQAAENAGSASQSH